MTNDGDNYEAHDLRMLVAIGFVLSGLLAWTQNSAPKGAAPRPLPQVSASYVIGPDDTLFVSVWKEPDLTNSLPVRADGMISMPLLNDVQAAGLTPDATRRSITDKLKKFISDPHVTVVVTQMNSQRIYVTGEVSHSGAVNLAARHDRAAGAGGRGLYPVCQHQRDLCSPHRKR